MGTGSGILDLVMVIVVGGGLMVVVSAPYWLSDLASSQRDKFEQEAIQQSEIARKVAIAEAANAARRRGETFVPPADYDR